MSAADRASPSCCRRPNVTQIVVLGAFVLNVLVTYLSETGLYGCTNAGVSRRYDTLITPPGWAFAIWGIIFLWEGAACVLQMVPTTTADMAKDALHGNSHDASIGPSLWDQLRRIPVWTVAWCSACFFQCLWSIVFCQSVTAAAVLLALIFLSLLVAQQQAMRTCWDMPTMSPQAATTTTNTATNGSNEMLESNTTNPPPVVEHRSIGQIRIGQLLRYLLFVAPFSLHLGWVTAASTLNVNLAVVSQVSSSNTLVSYALCSLVWVTGISVVFACMGTPYTRSRPDIFFAVGVSWALFAISKRHSAIINTSEQGFILFPTMVTDGISTAAGFAALMTSAVVCCTTAAAVIRFVADWRSTQEEVTPSVPPLATQAHP